MAEAVDIARDVKLRQQVVEEIRAAKNINPSEFIKGRELFYFTQGAKYYPNPIIAIKEGYAQFPEFYKTVRAGDFTLNNLKYRFGYGFCVPALFIGCLSYYVGKSSAYLFRKDGDVLGVKH